MDRSAMRRYASLFGEVLLYQHQRIVTMTKVHIASNNIHLEIIRFHTIIETLVTFETRQQRVYLAPFISENGNFDLSTALCHVTIGNRDNKKTVKCLGIYI